MTAGYVVCGEEQKAASKAPQEITTKVLTNQYALDLILPGRTCRGVDNWYHVDPNASNRLSWKSHPTKYLQPYDKNSHYE
jgi:hypothetical protein